MKITSKISLVIAGMVSAMAHAHASTTAFNLPTLDFGTVTSWAVQIDPGQAIYQLSGAYSRELTFSLSSTSDVRIDMRTVGTEFKYNTTEISSAQFDIFDANHTLVGSASVDPTFSASTCPSPTYIYGGTCNTELGMTFSSTLQAGNYSIEFRPIEVGHNFSPEIRFGVALNNPAFMPTYLAQLTPPLPEPSTGAGFLLGLVALSFIRKKSKR